MLFDVCPEASVAASLLLFWRVPTLRAITEDVPMLMPRAMLVSTMVNGKVKVMAATWAVLSCPMKPISSICTRMLDDTPIIIGAVSLASDEGTWPWVKSRLDIAESIAR